MIPKYLSPEQENEEMLRGILSLVVNSQGMKALGRLLAREDEQALSVLRSPRYTPEGVAEAHEILRHNARFRRIFQAADPKRDPFNAW